MKNEDYGLLDSDEYYVSNPNRHNHLVHTYDGEEVSGA